MARKAGSLGGDYLTKPVSATALLNKLRTVLEKSGRLGLRPHAHRMRRPGPRGFPSLWESVVRDARTLCPVTDARISTADGHLTLSSPPLIEIRKNGVRAVFPMTSPPIEWGIAKSLRSTY
jgi:hypothetical protein